MESDGAYGSGSAGPAGLSGLFGRAEGFSRGSDRCVDVDVGEPVALEDVAVLLRLVERGEFGVERLEELGVVLAERERTEGPHRFAVEHRIDEVRCDLGA